MVSCQFLHCIVVLPLPCPSRFQPRIGVRGVLLIAGMTNERLLERSIPDPSPGHAFIAIAHAGWRRHTQGMKIRCAGWWKSQVSSVPRTPPLAGDKPQPYISLATLGCRCSGDSGWCRRPVPEFIPDRSPGHTFVPIAHAGWRRHTKV